MPRQLEKHVKNTLKKKLGPIFFLNNPNTHTDEKNVFFSCISLPFSVARTEHFETGEKTGGKKNFRSAQKWVVSLKEFERVKI